MFNAKRLSGWMALAVFATVGGAMVAADPAFAKVDVDKLTISGEVRVRYEYRTGVYFGSTTNQTGVLSYATERVRIGVGYDLTPDVSFFAQIQDARAWGSETGSGLQAGTGIGAVSSANSSAAGLNGVDLHQGYIQVKNVLAPGLGLKIGRQEIMYGDHRLFGNFGWSQIGNSFDAAKLMWQSDMVDIDFFWARIVDLGNAGLAGANGGVALTAGQPSGYTAIKGTQDQDIYGAYVTLKIAKSWTIEPYYFLLKDNRPSGTAVGLTGPTEVITSPQAPDQTRNTLGARINGKAGGLDATIEGAWQFGDMAGTANRGAAGGGNNVRDVRINAEAGAARLGYTFEPVPMKPRIGIEVDYASGDACVSKNTCNSGAGGTGHFNTFDNLYPTNHFHYGYMDLMAWRNMVNYQVMFDVKPSDVSKLQLNFMLHRLANKLDNWYRAGQVPYAFTAPTNTTASIGKELDLHYWHTFKEKFKFEVGYGHFWAGDYIKKNAQQVANGSEPGPVSTASFNGDSGQNWGYIMTSILF